MMKNILAAAVVASLMAAGPAMAVDEAEVLIVNGRDTLTLNSSAAVSYRQYFQHECPLILAAHESGRWMTQATGPKEKCDPNAIDVRRYIHSILANCEGGVRYGECWIVAIGRKIVWDGPIKFRKGKWTPKSDRQFSVTLAGESRNSTSGRSFQSTIGLITYRKDGRTADITFKPIAAFGTCGGQLNLIAGKPAPFTLNCSKMGQVTGMFDVNPDGRTGYGAGRGKGARHFDLTVLPRTDMSPQRRTARTASNVPQS